MVENGDAVALVDSDGVFADGWEGQLGDDFKDDAPTLKRFKNVGELAKFGMESKRKLGHDPSTLVKIPDETASEEIQVEQKAAFNKARGKPDTTDEYKYELSPELKIKLGDMDDDRLSKLKTFAHEKLNLTPTEFKEMLDYYHNDAAESIDNYDVIHKEQQAEAIEKGTAELKGEWKAGYEERLLRANAVLRKFGGADAVALFGAENNPEMAKFLDRIASVLSESTIKGLTGITEPTSSDIDAQIKKLRATEAYTNKMHPEHKDVNAKVLELYKKKKL